MKIMRFVVPLLMVSILIVGCREDSASNTVIAPNLSDNSKSPTESLAEANESSSEEIIIDCRSQEEWDSGHLEQAILIPHTKIADQIAEVTVDKSAKLVLY